MSDLQGFCTFMFAPPVAPQSGSGAITAVLLHVPCQLNQSQVTQLMSNLDSSQDDGTSRQLPDCIQGENGLVLTDLGRKQVGAPAQLTGRVCNP